MKEIVPKPKMGRPRKERPGILTQEQADALMTPRQLLERDARKQAALKGIETRQRNAVIAAEKEAEKRMEQANTFPEYWDMQRANLPPEDRAKFEARESDVLDLEFAMKKYVDGTYESQTSEEDKVPLSAIIEEVQQEVATFGICESIVLAVLRLWTSDEKELRERIVAKGGATVDLLKYGYRTALDGRLFEDFRKQFMVERKDINIPKYVSLTCACGSTTSVHAEIANAYQARAIRYGCQRCRDLEAKANAPAKALAAEYHAPESRIFDNFGRVRD